MDRLLTKTKFSRAIRRTPQIAFEEFVGAFFNRGQFITLLIAAGCTWFAFQNANLDARIQEADSWVNALKSFVVVTIFWAFISFLRAPFLSMRLDKQRGIWAWPNFIYHEPQLVATIHCNGSQSEQKFPFFVPDVEPESFVSFTVKFDGSEFGNIKCAVFGTVRTGNLHGGNGDRKLSCRLLDGNLANLYVVMPATMIDQTFRVYIDKYEMGIGR